MRRISWLPLASLIGIEVYARGFDGWGAWSTAPLFLLPAILGLAIGFGGGLEFVARSRAGESRRSTIIHILIALSPIAWLLVRRHFV